VEPEEGGHRLLPLEAGNTEIEIEPIQALQRRASKLSVTREGKIFSFVASKGVLLPGFLNPALKFAFLPRAK
jgi:hypothetical protein